MDVRMIAALPTTGAGSVAQFCREQQISRQTFYKWRARFAAEGLDGLQERSRRPARTANQTSSQVEDLLVRMRKQLAEAGEFNGPDSIRDRLLLDGVPGELPPATAVPSRATIARILTRRGQVKAQPRKRPRSSYHRFVADRPNQMWQSDWTGWQLADGRPVAIAGTLDDHSRLLVGIAAGSGDGTAELVWSVMTAAIARYGVPASSLTDNGLCYTTKHRGPRLRPAAFEVNLQALGCRCIASTPYHPQTCGKIERLWQTLKKWLRARPAHRSLHSLNAELAVFAEHYNTRRPHRALPGRQTPAAAFAATVHARPETRPLPTKTVAYRTHVSTGGTAVIGRFHVYLGARYKQLPVTAIKDGNHVIIFTGTTIIRDLEIDTSRRYQRLNPLDNPPPTPRR